MPLLSLASALVLALTGAAQDTPTETGPTAYVGARILTISGEPIDDGVMVVDNGKIVAWRDYFDMKAFQGE